MRIARISFFQNPSATVAQIPAKTLNGTHSALERYSKVAEEIVKTTCNVRGAHLHDVSRQKIYSPCDSGFSQLASRACQK